MLYSNSLRPNEYKEFVFNSGENEGKQTEIGGRGVFWSSTKVLHVLIHKYNTINEKTLIHATTNMNMSQVRRARSLRACQLNRPLWVGGGGENREVQWQKPRGLIWPEKDFRWKASEISKFCYKGNIQLLLYF